MRTEPKLKTCKNPGCGQKFKQLSSLQNCCCPKCYDEYKKHRAGESQKMLASIGEKIGTGFAPKFPKSPIVNAGTWGTEHDSLPKPSRKPIARYSKTNKNMARHLDEETIREVYERDGNTCIIPGCGKRNLDIPHHAFYGGQANHGQDRNEPHQLVTLCMDCHYDLHFKGKEGLREFCIDYLRDRYAQSQH